MSPAFRRHALVLLVLLCASCTTTSRQDPTSPPPFKSDSPVQVTAMVAQFMHRGAWIDFDEHFVAYDSIVLTVSKPDSHAWTRLHVQYQGIPAVDGRRIELGDVLRFTTPASSDAGCCEPYLSDIVDLEFVGSENPALNESLEH